MKRYFKHEADVLGPGVAYLEFDGEIPIRQVEKYGDLWLCSIKDYHPGIGPGLIDQALSELGLEPKHEISQEELEEAWNEALKHVQSAQKYSRPDGYAPVHIRQAMVSYVHKQSVDSVCFSPDSTRLATAAFNDCVLLWDVAAQQPVRVLERRSLEAMPSQVSFSADGRLLAASVGGGIVQLWNGDGRMVAGLPGHDPGPTEAVFSPKGTLLASGDLTGRVRLWDVESRQVLCSFLGAPLDRPEGSLPREWRVDCFTFAPDGTRLAFDSPDIRGRVQV